MAATPPERVRNIGIVAHIDAGKTTTTERFLFYTGKSYKMGEVHDGQAVMDFREDERNRGITISDAATTLIWRDHQINLIDTPGHVDFTAEVERALRVLDGAVVIFDGVEGVEPQSETVWHQADRYGVARIAFINKMDRQGADFDGSVKAIEERLGMRAIPIQMPQGAAETFAGVVDLVEDRLLVFDQASLGREVRVAPVPEELRDEARRRRGLMIEALADYHDPLAEKFLADAPIAAEDLLPAVRAATLSRKAVPVLCGAALRNVGVQPLLDAICAYLPSPQDLPPVEGVDPRTRNTVRRKPASDEPFAAIVFKVAAASSADMFYLRVYSGALDAGEKAVNPRTGKTERLRRILRMHADRGEPVERIEAGDIVAAVGLQHSGTGDTLCDEKAPILLEPIRFPATVVSVAVEPRTSADRDRFAEVLARIQREDQTFRASVDPDTGQTLISGMGELHLEVVIQHMQRDLGVEVAYGKPRVSHRETVRAPGSAVAEYRRQVAGENLFARVELGIEPRPHAEGLVEVADRLKQGTLPQNFIPQMIESVRNAANGGGLYGYPVTDVRVTLLDAKYDDAGQPEIALNSATSLAFREALRAAGAVVLEPYGRLEIRVPEDYLGGVVKTLNQRRAVVEETRFTRGISLIRGVAPIGEMFGYLTVLRSHTQGRGSYSLEPLDYRPLPDNLIALHHERLY
jgi:elongation factor G